jgi:hypothetical protein
MYELIALFYSHNFFKECTYTILGKKQYCAKSITNSIHTSENRTLAVTKPTIYISYKITIGGYIQRIHMILIHHEAHMRVQIDQELKPQGNYYFKYQLLYLIINFENLPCLSALVKETFTAFLENVKIPKLLGSLF